MSGDRAQTVLDFVVGMSVNVDGAERSAAPRTTSPVICGISLSKSILVRYDVSR